MNLPEGMVYDDLDLVDQIVWHPRKKELTDWQQFRLKMLAAAIDLLRETDIDVYNVTVDELIEIGKNTK